MDIWIPYEDFYPGPVYTRYIPGISNLEVYTVVYLGIYLEYYIGYKFAVHFSLMFLDITLHGHIYIPQQDHCQELLKIKEIELLLGVEISFDI